MLGAIKLLSRISKKWNFLRASYDSTNHRWESIK
jgi:hypothetical protein